MKAQITELRTRIQDTVDLMPADQIDSLLSPLMDSLDDVEDGLARGTMNVTEAEMQLIRIQTQIDGLGVL